MKTNILYILLIIGFTMGGCDYLDIVPDERPVEEDAFVDKQAAENYLYSCYAFMPKEREGVYLYQHGDIVTDFDKEFLQGNYSAANIGDFHFWSRMYAGIKRCHQLLLNVDGVPRMEEELKTIYKAEAKFLLAYFHFCLLRAYGPVIIADEEYPVDMPASDYPKRASFDECVDWIATKFDEAYNEGLVERHTPSYYGRANQTAAKALKARLLVYAASPLFNGNSEFYENKLIDPETNESLMNLTYDDAKWERAYQATLEAVELADKNYELYKGVASEDMPYPADDIEYSLRMTFVDRMSDEVIWADTREESHYNLQNQSTPRDPTNDGASWNGVGPSLETVMSFYTENGLPMSEDPAYYAEEEYYETDLYDGETTCKMHLKREPRFYAWISFHNGWYEMSRDGEQRIRTQYRNEDLHGKGTRTRNFSLTGYLVKKGVSPAYDTQNGFVNYPWPIIRLAELYLLHAEAAVETERLDESKVILNKVRERAGIPNVEESWEGIAVLNKEKLREIVRQERMNELFLEGHLQWDIKRWKIAEQFLNKNPQGLNTNGIGDADFFQPTVITMSRKFNSPINYLLPIDNREINMNNKLVQNPGY